MSPEPEPPAVLQEPHTQPIEMVMRKVWDRPNRRNEHFVGCIVGREGAGKSLTCLKIASLLDPEFSSDQVFFRIEEFLKLLRDEEYRSGGFYILDEAGVSLGKRTWQDRGQILANQALQLIRDHNIGLLFSLPRIGELDSQAEGRLHAQYEITDKVPDEHVSGRWKWVDPERSMGTGNIYRKYPRTEEGERVTSLAFTPPPASLIAPYEERKTEFQQEQYDETIGELEGEGESDESDGQTIDEIADEILTDDGVRSYIKEVNNGSQIIIDKQKIKNEYDVGRRKAKQVKNKLQEEIEIDVM